jgi:hypothetical protein
LSNLIVLGQKTDNISFEGYFKNNPKQYLPEKPYTVKYTVSEWFKEQMKEKEVKLELKGYEEGTGYTVIFMADDPELKAEVKESFNMTTKKNEYKAIVKAESNAKVIILNEKNEKAYEINFVPKLQMAISEGLGVKATKAEAEAQNKEMISKKKDYLKKMYVKEVVNAYQDTLDAYFGKYNKQEKFRMALIKPKDFTYDDFNGAVEKFKVAVSTPEINMADVESTIEILEKCKLEYQPGKKTRICDVNIDELYLNLVQAYMVKGDYENAKINWEKSSEIKGNRTAEGYVARFYNEQVSNLNNYPVSKANYAPVPTISESAIKSNKLFFNLFFDFYLTQVLRQTSLIIDYIPIYTPDLKRMEANQTYSDYIQEKLIVNYNYLGVPLSAAYSKTEEDEKPRNYQFDFKYDNNKIISVTQNNIPKFNLAYNGDTLKSVNIRMNQTTNYIYNMDYSNPERTEIKLQVEKDGKKSDSHSRYYVKLNKDGSIKGYYLDSYVLKEKLYDANGNWIGVKGTNESTGEDYEVNFTIETDEKGNITKRSYNKSLQVERKLIYN